jgi:L-Lysine epsilon oxidase N-terminal/L-lysine epsilon oxidase C-terminal domain
MAFIQFRVHPSVGMARIGQSTDWYFVGPEVPRFIQEQYVNLRHRPHPLRHPATTNPNAAQPDPGRYRDKSTPTPLIMPQAARFRVFAYIYDRGQNEPYKVMELKPEHAEIAWTVTVANAKAVKRESGVSTVVPNEPGPKPLFTKISSPHTNCQTGMLPNLAWLTLEKDDTNKPTGRLHVIGNEGKAEGGPLPPPPTPTAPFPAVYLYQNGWQDTAADGSVVAIVEPKAAFTSLFPGSKYLITGQTDPVDLPPDGKVAALPAWVVVNLPDYVPDMGHFVSLWDLALGQAWKQVVDRKAKAVEGRHHLVVAPRDVSSYAFYDYHLHIHPQLALFSHVAYTSGQVRAGSIGATGFVDGITIHGRLEASTTTSGSTIKVKVQEALRIKAASLGQPFLVLLSASATDPLAGAHEFVRCSVVADSGALTVTRGQERTTPRSWPMGTRYFAATKAGFIETKLLDSIPADETKIKVDVQAAHKMPEPTPPGPDSRDSAFKVALSGGGHIEWIDCAANAKTKGELTNLTRGVDGTVARPWGLLTDDPMVIAPALGHKRLDARARIDELSDGEHGPIQDMLFKRLRLPQTLYDRTTFRKHPAIPPIPATPDHGEIPARPAADAKSFPREFGRRMDFETVSSGLDYHSGSLNVDPGGSLSRFHELFIEKRKKACKGDPLATDPGKALPDKLPGENYEEDAATHVAWLDDYYWIVSERDMPMLREYAFTDVQFRQFWLWAKGEVEYQFNPQSKRLFERLFKRSSLENFFNQNHSIEEYLNELIKRRPRYAPAFLDMASMGRMLGGSFLPGIEIGREGGKAANWSMYHGGTTYFPDLRFHPQASSAPHRAGTLTKDLAIPWFADYIACAENFWPTSRPQVVYQKNGFAYPWLYMAKHANSDADFKAYWTKLGFIRRQPNDEFFEEETLFDRP